MQPKYPEIEVNIIGRDGNAFAILGACDRAAKRKIPSVEWDSFMDEATSGDYNHLLRTVMKWFNVT